MGNVSQLICRTAFRVPLHGPGRLRLGLCGCRCRCTLGRRGDGARFLLGGGGRAAAVGLVERALGGGRLRKRAPKTARVGRRFPRGRGKAETHVPRPFASPCSSGTNAWPRRCAAASPARPAACRPVVNAHPDGAVSKNSDRPSCRRCDLVAYIFQDEALAAPGRWLGRVHGAVDVVVRFRWLRRGHGH